MARMDDLIDLVNTLEANLETLRHLAEIGPCLDGQDARYFPHALTLLAVIAAYGADLERVVRNLAAQLRAVDEEDVR
jgi:hypothetical protein